MNDVHLRPLATFSGIRRVPLLATSYNSFYPSLIITDYDIKIVVVRKHRIPLSEVDTIEARWLLGHQLTVVPRMGYRTFGATFYGRPAVTEALRALQNVGAPLDGTALSWL